MSQAGAPESWIWDGVHVQGAYWGVLWEAAPGKGGEGERTWWRKSEAGTQIQWHPQPSLQGALEPDWFFRLLDWDGGALTLLCQQTADAWRWHGPGWGGSLELKLFLKELIAGGRLLSSQKLGQHALPWRGSRQGVICPLLSAFKLFRLTSSFTFREHLP